METGCAQHKVDPFAALPNEMLVEVLKNLSSGRYLVRCNLVSRRWRHAIVDPGSVGAWRDAAVATARRMGLEGPWLREAASVRGWVWVWCALDPLPEPAPPSGGLGCRPRCCTFLATCGEHDGRGRPHGYAFTMARHGGNWAAGTWHEGWAEGKAVSCDGRGARYEGQYVRGKRDGHGVETYANGERYEGQWKDNAKHGHGAYTFRWNEVYEGGWERGSIHGRGTITYPKCSKACLTEWHHGRRLGTTIVTGARRRWQYWYHETQDEDGVWRSNALFTSCPGVMDACAAVVPPPDRPLDGCVDAAIAVALSALAPVEGEGGKNDAIVHGPECATQGRCTYIEALNDDIPNGPAVTHYCNGDVLYDYYYDGGRRATDARVRFVCSPRCPDARFRSTEMRAPAWIIRETPVDDESDGTHRLIYPHPIEAPDAFALFRDYFTCGFLSVAQRYRAIVASNLADAVEHARSMSADNTANAH